MADGDANPDLGAVPNTTPENKPKTRTAGKPRDEGTSGSDELNPILMWLCKSGPKWARIPATIGALCVAIGSPVIAVLHPTDTRNAAVVIDKKSADNATLDMAASAKVSSDQALLAHVISGQGVTPDEQEKAKDALKKTFHQMWHLTNANEAAVQWNVFGKSSPKDKDYFGYKVFPSDRCLLISRVENGEATAEWLTDPNQPQGQAGPPASHASVDRSVNTSHVEPAIYLDGQARLSLDGSVVRLLSVSGEAPGNPSPQAGMCLNPHPWAYQESAGPPIDGCQVPIFRRWADGCTHVQVINHCMNVAGPIVWQYCAPVHHP